MRTVDNQVLTALHQIRDAIKNKDCCNGGGSSDDSSKEVTIDDVVKFIHDNISSDYPEFSYTTYEDIPLVKDSIAGHPSYVRGTDQEIDDAIDAYEEQSMLKRYATIFRLGQYNITYIALGIPL